MRNTKIQNTIIFSIPGYLMSMMGAANLRIFCPLIILFTMLNPWGTIPSLAQENGPKEIMKPHTFHPGTPAKSSEVNENFDVLFQALNQMAGELERLKSGLLTANVTGEFYNRDAFQIQSANVRYEAKLDSLIFQIETKGDAGSVVPVRAGGVDGAPVLGYVFITSLTPTEVGFDDVAGTVALAITSHPDFDDTPLWDEDNNEVYDDDGIVYHSHWVVLTSNQQAKTGLAVLQKSETSILPPTAPMDMYLDSPGFDVIENGSSIGVIVPLDRVGRNTAFKTDAVTAFMQVDASGAQPLLKVERVYDNLSENLTPDLDVENADQAPANAWPAASTTANDASFEITGATVKYVESIDTLLFSMDVTGQAAVQIPDSQMGDPIDGAPVLGYVFPTSLDPKSVGFKGQEGTLALAVTSHPSFDDTPLWDENMNDDYADDGEVYHVHWVVLVEDENSGAMLSVPSQANQELLPPTAPMAMYLDSPGFHAFAEGSTVNVIVPAQRVNNHKDFKFDAVTAVMAVDASGANPILRVNEVKSVLGGALEIESTIDTVSDLDN